MWMSEDVTKTSRCPCGGDASDHHYVISDYCIKMDASVLLTFTTSAKFISTYKVRVGVSIGWALGTFSQMSVVTVRRCPVLTY